VLSALQTPFCLCAVFAKVNELLISILSITVAKIDELGYNVKYDAIVRGYQKNPPDGKAAK